jgi:CIC family chloride channel protein
MDLASFLGLGLTAGLVSMLYPWTLSTFRRLFAPLENWHALRPAIGGLLVGLLALVFPQVLGLGAGWLQLGFNNRVGEIVDPNGLQLGLGLHLQNVHVEDAEGAAVLFSGLVLLKLLATAVTLGSRGSGGVIGPGLLMGGFLGIGYWEFLRIVFPQASGVAGGPSIFMIVGMAAFLAGIANAPLGFSLLAIQLTGQYQLIVPVLSATVLSRLVTSKSKALFAERPLSGTTST